MGKSKIYCERCQKKCTGEVLRVTDKYFHKSCFQCTKCQKSLAQGGFFSKEGNYYCTADYQRLYGTKCAACNQYVEGEVVSTLGKTYHQKCFTCSKCKSPFKSGSKVTNTGKEVLCETCIAQPASAAAPVAASNASAAAGDAQLTPTRATTFTSASQPHVSRGKQSENYDPNDCAGCGEQLKEGQALVALDRQWHVWCFRCKNCTVVLDAEYIGKDGMPYCEKCYQRSYGVKCAYCNRYISGKVLQAGGNHHFHPTCARCTKCGDPFGDGEEMYLQGNAIWHPRCGPGPSADGGLIINGTGASNGHLTDTECDRMSNSAMSEMQYNRTVSPGLMLRDYNRQGGYGYEDISRIYTYSYLTDEPQGLRKPIDPYDKTPISPHFHRPYSAMSHHGGGTISMPTSRPHSRNRSAMRVLVDTIRAETPRPKSPAMNNEEPIELSHYPAAKKPPPGEKSKIERDDFPAPPYPYTDPERRRRYSDSYKGVAGSDEENGEDQVDSEAVKQKLERLKKEEEELAKIQKGMGGVFLKDLKENAKKQKWRQSNLDPRNASRTPSASKEPIYKLRYESSIGASPSRNSDHQKPFYDDETTQFDRSTSYRGSVGRNIGSTPSYNDRHDTLPPRPNTAIHSYRSPPKPGYGFKTSTLPATMRNGYSSDFSYGGLGDKTQSTEFSCAKSDVSVDSITEGDRRALMAVEIPASSTYSGNINKPLAQGVNTYGRHKSASKNYRHFKKGSNNKVKAKEAVPLKKQGEPRWYAADDVKRPIPSRKSHAKPTRLRSSITPGTVLIVLAGRFRGKRVVFLKQLASGLLLVTGPYKINGVPIRRLNQAYVIATSTKIDVSSIDVKSIDDKFFAKAKEAPKKKKDGEEFFEAKEEKKVISEARKKEQSRVDGELLKLITKVPHLKHYLNAKFTLTKGLYPHQIKF